MKKCSKCGEEKSLEGFCKDKSKRDGLSCYCKICIKEYRIDPKNKKRIKEYSKKYNARPENKIRAKEYKAEWYLENKEHIKIVNAEWKEKNPERVKEIQKKYAKTPRARFLSYVAHARKKNIPFLLSFDEFMTFWNKPCFYCGCEIKTVGIDRTDNTVYVMEKCVPCCWTCNDLKGKKNKEDFLSCIVRIYERQANVKQ